MTTQMFSTREVPWMKLGELADEPKTSVEAIEMSGLNFTVSARQAAFSDADDDGNWLSVARRRAIVRDDTQEFFEFVSDGYQPLQYREAFDFMDAIEPKYVAAGSLKDGRQGFLVVQPEKTVSPNGDDVEMFVILRTSHDRSRGVEIAFMPLRGMCMNQLTLRSFARGVKHRWSITHSKNMKDKLAEAHIAMTQLDDYTEAFNALALRLMKQKVEEDDARTVLDKSITHGGVHRDESIEVIIDLWKTNTETVGFNGTGWGLVNAISEHMDWRDTGKRGTAEVRFLQALNGYSHKALNTATSALLAIGN